MTIIVEGELRAPACGTARIKGQGEPARMEGQGAPVKNESDGKSRQVIRITTPAKSCKT